MVRHESGKGPARRLRQRGHVPSVAYARGADSAHLAVPQADLRAILQSGKGRNSLIELSVEGGQSFTVMVRDVSVHPVSRQLLHADFIRVKVDQPLVVDVPFRTVGRAKGEINGGTLLRNVRSLPVRCLPAQIPVAIEAEVSELEIDAVLRLSDLTLPEGVEVLRPADQKLVVVVPPRIEPVAVVEGEAAAEGEAAEGEAAEGEAEGEAAEGKSADGGSTAADDRKRKG
ncbi:MAG: 50S ribosomal protein L25 [Deltaproteobacteria bacterium]|nr:50S ribosomal protein L25 [Deltaproteobacteria bacterium]